MLRHEEYELPVEAIREMIVNAHCHRNMLDEACVSVAIYDDRLEVKTAMLEKYPSLRAMYDPADDNTQVLYFNGGEAVFSSFTAAPETVTF